MKFLDLASASGPRRMAMLDYLHDSGARAYSSAIDDGLVEVVESLPDPVFSVAHSVVKTPCSIRRGTISNPARYIELDFPLEEYVVVRVGFDSLFGDDFRDFQLLVVPDERVELVAYSSGGNGPGRHVELQVDNSPHEDVSSSMPVQPGKLVEPPQEAAGVSASRMIGLRSFDRFARPLVESLGFELVVKGLERGPGRVVDPVGVRRGVELGVVDGKFVHESIEGGADQVEPFAEEHRDFQWKWFGCLKVNGFDICVEGSALLKRIRLYVFARDGPHLLSARSRSLKSGVEKPEIVIHNY